MSGFRKLFSQREKEKNGSLFPDVFSYDKLPMPLRQQIIHIWKDALGHPQDQGTYDDMHDLMWKSMADELAREFGKDSIIGRGNDPFEKFAAWFLGASDAHAFDAVDWTFELIGRLKTEHGGGPLRSLNARIVPSVALETLNYRFRLHGVGFRFEEGTLVRVDSEFLHEDAVKPTLSLISAKGFEAANEDFRAAYAHYRESHWKEAIVAANRAFEATLKAVAKRKKITVADGASASRLVDALRDGGVFAKALGGSLEACAHMLKSGVPIVRNKQGGHGAAPDDPKVTEHAATFAMHMAAASIVLVVRASQA